MKEILLEVIATSADDCALIEELGGDRIELTCALTLGGLTPSAGLLREARAATRLPIMAMARPREAGFCYSRREFLTMLHDVEHLLAHGADGVVFGALKADGAIDVARCQEIVALAAGTQTVFHRAFDVIPDPLVGLEQLIDLGVTRILTSGQAANALAGAPLIRQLVERAQQRMEILPGGGVNSANVNELLTVTGCTQVHVSLSETMSDPSMARSQVGMLGAVPPEGHFRRTSRATLREFTRHITQVANHESLATFAA